MRFPKDPDTCGRGLSICLKIFWLLKCIIVLFICRLKIAPNVVIRQLSINVASSDESYMPQQIVVSAGRDIYHLTGLNDVKIPAHFTGNFSLVENMKAYFPVMQLDIKRCHSDGCDTRIRQVKAIGYRYLHSHRPL